MKSAACKRGKLIGIIGPLMLCAMVDGCAGIAQRDDRDPDDPLEPLNRAVLATNTALDEALIRPVAESYRKIVPEFVRDRLRSVIDNLAEPRIFVNEVLQGRSDAAGITIARFLVNTVGGMAGMFDIATGQGLPKQSGDFGQTLHAWGVADGPYLVLLLFGPSNVRDALGFGVDAVTTPPGVFASGHSGTVITLTVGAVDGTDLRARNIESLDEIKAGALDYYAQLKSIWQQRRRAQLREGSGLEDNPPELLDPGAPVDPGAGAAPAR